MIKSLENISERKFIGSFLKLLHPAIRVSTIEWAETYRILTSEESVFIGKFDCSRMPAMEYIYDCLDNKDIYIVAVMKASQVGWSELTNNYLGKLIHTQPNKIMWAFPGREPSRMYSREKLKPFFEGTKVLNDIINVGVAKASYNFFKFPGGWLKLVTTGAISNLKSSSIPIIGVEEPDDVKEDIQGQGDGIDLMKGRQKTFPIGKKKLLYGGTPTDKDFSRVENAYKESNQLVFKAQCHSCEELIELSFDNLKYSEYQDRRIDEIYGKDDPSTAYYECPSCGIHWSSEQKNLNILAGKQFGFTDFTGRFSKGWHPKKPEVTECFGFHVPELLSSLQASDFVALAEKEIKAKIALAKGQEGLMKSFVNNSKGLPYASGVSSMDTDEMKTLRSNYPEHIVPMEGLIVTMGVDVQDNRFAIIKRAHGRFGNSWLVTWKEIFGNVKVQERDAQGNFIGVWGELWDEIMKPIPHAGNKWLNVAACSIDSADNTELVYRFVQQINEVNPYVFAVKGVRDLRYSEDEIYLEPGLIDAADSDKRLRKTLAETMGVTVFRMGAHRAHDEILNRIYLNKNKDARSNIFYFNQQSYGQYEEQMTSCRKIVDVNSSYNKSVYKLVPGQRKEAMDGEKLSLHASYAIGIRNYTNDNWRAIEQYLYS